MMTMGNTPGPHQHDWLMLRERDGSLHVMANASCAVCGLTPEAVANAAAIEMLLAKYAAALEIVRAVADTGDDVFVPERDEHGIREDDRCAYCNRSLWEDNNIDHPEHTPDCPVTKARALLAQEEAE